MPLYSHIFKYNKKKYMFHSRSNNIVATQLPWTLQMEKTAGYARKCWEMKCGKITSRKTKLFNTLDYFSDLMTAAVWITLWEHVQCIWPVRLWWLLYNHPSSIASVCWYPGRKSHLAWGYSVESHWDGCQS